MMQQRRQQENLADLSELSGASPGSAPSRSIAESSELAAFSERNHNYRDSQIRLSRTRSTLFPLLEGISSISLLLLLTLGSGKLEAGTVSTGDLVAMILYIGQLVFPTALLGFTLNTFQIGQVSLERVEELLQRVPLIRDQQPTSAGLTANQGNDRLKGTLEARGLRIRYEGAEQDALHGVDFSIKDGELVAVVGPVGCGKTTLAKAFGRMVPVEPGQLFLDGVDVTCLPLDTLRRSVAMVPQEGFLFTSTLADNLRYGDPEANDERVRHSAEQARLADDVRGFPDGFQTLVGERGITLSGGQRQRTALGRALLVSSPVLVLDDALASVDNNTAAAVLESIHGQEAAPS